MPTALVLLQLIHFFDFLPLKILDLNSLGRRSTQQRSPNPDKCFKLWFLATPTVCDCISLSMRAIWQGRLVCYHSRLFEMFSRCSFAICIVGLVCLSDNVRAQQGKYSTESRLPNTRLYSGISVHSGDRTTFRDASGRTQGTATHSGSRTTFRDSSGRTVASADTSGSRTTVRDASGRTIETATTNRDRTTFRSSSGSNLGSASQSRNQTTFRDAGGRSIGSASNSGSRTTFRDSSGRSTGSASKGGK